MIRAEKIADGRVPRPARSGYISKNRGTVLEKSRRGKVYPAVFRTRQGESGRRPISCVRFTLWISSYPAVSRFDQGIPCCDVYPTILCRGSTKNDFTVDEGNERLNPSRDKKVRQAPQKKGGENK